MKPPQISELLKPDVIGQNAAVKEVSVALYKHLIGHRTGNVLMIGGSGTGKTTIMRSVETLLRTGEKFKEYGTVVRINANLLADLASRGQQSSVVLEKLAAEAALRLGADATPQDIAKAVSHGIVFVDEIDKIRSHVGERPNVSGIIAQESLLTLMEGEVQNVAIPVDPHSGDGRTVPMPVDTKTILFIMGGAFEELYDQVFDRVTANGKNPPWRLVTKADGSIERQIVFQLAKHMEHADLFNYGMSPQFLARFDSIVTLRNLGSKDLVTIFRDTSDSIWPAAVDYFANYGVTLKLDESALNYIADKASENSRIGARALKEVFSRIIKEYEYDPFASGLVNDQKELVIDLEMAKQAFDQS